jgi:thioredoxin reductase (NADPH)
MQHEKVIIIGSGPAGLTAALYTARANLNPVVITGGEVGGQVAITYEVENYPGFPEGLSGPDLVEKFQKQAERFGTRVVQAVVTDVDFTQGPPFTVKTHKETYQAETVIITTGASARRLGVPW